jgi:sugar (pentulose or hexulose) kinase
MSILTDVLGRGGVVPSNCDAAHGAALMAGQGAGILDSLARIESNMKSSKVVDYDTDNHASYNDIFSRYMELAGT